MALSWPWPCASRRVSRRRSRPTSPSAWLGRGWLRAATGDLALRGLRGRLGLRGRCGRGLRRFRRCFARGLRLRGRLGLRSRGLRGRALQSRASRRPWAWWQPSASQPALTPRRRSIRPSWRRPRTSRPPWASRLPWRQPWPWASSPPSASRRSSAWRQPWPWASSPPSASRRSSAWRQPWPWASHRLSSSPPTSAVGGEDESERTTATAAAERSTAAKRSGEKPSHGCRQALDRREAEGGDEAHGCRHGSREAKTAAKPRPSPRRPDRPPPRRQSWLRSRKLPARPRSPRSPRPHPHEVRDRTSSKAQSNTKSATANPRSAAKPVAKRKARARQSHDRRPAVPPRHA